MEAHLLLIATKGAAHECLGLDQFWYARCSQHDSPPVATAPCRISSSSRNQRGLPAASAVLPARLLRSMPGPRGRLPLRLRRLRPHEAPRFSKRRLFFINRRRRRSGRRLFKNQPSSVPHDERRALVTGIRFPDVVAVDVPDGDDVIELVFREADDHAVEHHILTLAH